MNNDLIKLFNKFKSDKKYSDYIFLKFEYIDCSPKICLFYNSGIFFYKYGKLHNEHGPAVIYKYLMKYALNGKFYGDHTTVRSDEEWVIKQIIE